MSAPAAGAAAGDDFDPSPQTPEVPAVVAAPIAASLAVWAWLLAGSSIGRAFLNDSGTSASRTRSWGRRGPAMLGSTVDRSSETVSLKIGSGESAEWKSPCSFMYDSTRATRSFERPVKRRYLSVTSSTGKIAQVAPYSGDMLPMVARSASGRFESPGP